MCNNIIECHIPAVKCQHQLAGQATVPQDMSVSTVSWTWRTEGSHLVD